MSVCFKWEWQSSWVHHAVSLNGLSWFTENCLEYRCRFLFRQTKLEGRVRETEILGENFGDSNFICPNSIFDEKSYRTIFGLVSVIKESNLWFHISSVRGIFWSHLLGSAIRFHSDCLRTPLLLSQIKNYVFLSPNFTKIARKFTNFTPN